VSWIDRPPRIGSGIAAAWFIVVSAVFSDAGVPFPTFVVILSLSLLITAGCVLRMGVALVRWRQGHMKPGRDLCAWIVMPAILVAGYTGALSPLFLSGRVYLSSRALIDKAPVLSSISPADLYTNGQWVGLFKVREFSQFGRELRFITNSCGLLDSCGLVYAPEGPPQRHGKDSFAHLYGPWWHLYQSF
jgi:hypothetical protein